MALNRLLTCSNRCFGSAAASGSAVIHGRPSGLFCDGSCSQAVALALNKRLAASEQQSRLAEDCESASRRIREAWNASCRRRSMLGKSFLVAQRRDVGSGGSHPATDPEEGRLAMCPQGHQRVMPLRKAVQAWCGVCRRPFTWRRWKALRANELMPELDGAGDPPCRLSVSGGDLLADDQLPHSGARMLRGVRRLGRLPMRFHGKTKVEKLPTALESASSRKRRRCSPCAYSAGGGAHPADDELPALDFRVLMDVCRLGHLPKLFSDPRTEEDRAEHRLADRIRKSKVKLLPTTQKFLRDNAEGRLADRKRKSLGPLLPTTQSFLKDEAERRLVDREREREGELFNAIISVTHNENGRLLVELCGIGTSPVCAGPLAPLWPF